MKHLNAVVATLGAALLSSTAFTAQAAGNPFTAQELSGGYSLAAGEKAAEGACGEGKCGGEMKAEGEGKCGEGKCGADDKASAKAAAEGKCGEGKCGEGKCGADKTEKAE
ncbi:HvfA family oxazolone/thioamide-modified RiPP metallophore [Pseudomonas borbori]